MKLQEAALINTSVGPAGSNQLQAKEAADAAAPPPPGCRGTPLTAPSHDMLTLPHKGQGLRAHKRHMGP
jgi:hypothetical protein